MHRAPSSNTLLPALAIFLVLAAAALLFLRNRQPGDTLQLTNASYDPTRQLYSQIDTAFIPTYEKQTGQSLQIRQSHGASTAQAEAVINGLPADVVTLALPSDIDAIAKHGLIAPGWRARLPNDSHPYTSTIVFVVRKSNPRQIKDWPDLIRPGITVITPDPRISANGKLSLLAAWGSVIHSGGTETHARAFVEKLYRNVQTFGQNPLNSSTSFILASQGDVQLTWEDEAIREVRESPNDLEIVYPAASIRAEPSVAWVDASVAKHGTQSAAQAYLAFLFTAPAQEIIAANGYRPSNPEILANHAATFPNIVLFPITLIAANWDDAETKFFGPNGIYEILRTTLAR